MEELRGNSCNVPGTRSPFLQELISVEERVENGGKQSQIMTNQREKPEKKQVQLPDRTPWWTTVHTIPYPRW
jgi:hypothetical protein